MQGSDQGHVQGKVSLGLHIILDTTLLIVKNCEKQYKMAMLEL